MLVSIREAHYEGAYRIRLTFNTGEQGVADLEDIILKYPAAASLKDPTLFADFHLDEWPTLVWDCGFDLAPETLYERATGIRVPWLNEN